MGLDWESDRESGHWRRMAKGIKVGSYCGEASEWKGFGEPR